MKRSKLKQREQKATQRLGTARPKVSSFARKKSRRVVAENRQGGYLNAAAAIILIRLICVALVVWSLICILRVLS